MRIWIAGGGTGGHVYPGLAVLQAARRVGPVEPLYVGGRDSVEERLTQRAGLEFVGIPAGGLHGLGLRRMARNLVKLARGFVAALRLGRRERPEALFVTGGYASVPVALAAWILQVPILLYLPDIEPGLAVRFIARLATRIGVTTEDSRRYLRAEKVVVTGYPVRAEFADVNPQKAREALELEPDRPVLLVFGGSHGARSINRAVTENLEELLREVQVVHLTGELDWPWVAERAEELEPELRARYRPLAYLHEMEQALAVGDLVVCRAGASTLGELPYFGLPAILVPYPHAWRYQRVNAEWLTERGAGVVLEDDRLERELLPVVRELIGDRERLERMEERSRALSRPEAAQELAQQLWGLAAEGGTQ